MRRIYSVFQASLIGCLLLVPMAHGAGNISSIIALLLDDPASSTDYSLLQISEVDYDNLGADDNEFIELHNTSDSSVSLLNLSLVLVNGSGEAEYARVDLDSLGSLASGAYAVIGDSAVISALPLGTANLPLPASIQNGPDAIALFHRGTNTLIDALSYEGEVNAATIVGVAGTFDLVYGTANGEIDTGPGSLNQVSNTEDDLTDWQYENIPTPGRPSPGANSLRISEVDYDNVGPDTMEFIELYNDSAASVSLAGLSVVVVNGGTSLEAARFNLDSMVSLSAGAYAVLGSAGVVAALPGGVVSITIPDNSLQNGSPDAVVLFDRGTEMVLDALSYEGEINDAVIDGTSYDLVEGAATPLLDSGTNSLNQLAETHNDINDWESRDTPTPGGPAENL